MVAITDQFGFFVLGRCVLFLFFCYFYGRCKKEGLNINRFESSVIRR